MRAYLGSVTPPRKWGRRGRDSAPSFPKKTAGCREGWRTLFLPLCKLAPALSSTRSTYQSPAHLTHQTSAPAPPSLSPKSFETELNHHHCQHHPEDGLRKRLGQPPAPLDPVPPPEPSSQSSRVLCPYHRIPASSKVPPAPPVFLFRSVSRHTPSVPRTRCLPIAQ